MVLLLSFLLCYSVLFAQDDSNSRIDRLSGGIIGINLKWSGEFFSGLGSRADAMGGSISTLFSDAEIISSNPAGLGFARNFSFTLDWSPPLIIDPGGIFDLKKKINDALIDAAENNSPEDAIISDIVTDAELNSELDMRGGLKGGAVMYGNEVLGIGASFHQPFRIENQLNMSGMEFLAVALDDGGDELQRIFGTVSGNFNMKFTMESSSIGVGTKISRELSAGVVFDNFNGDLNFSGTFQPEAIISSAGGDTRAFNDPALIQYDSLFATITGDWEGNASRFRFGLGYHPNRDVSFDVVYAAPFKMELTGPFKMVHNSIRALNLDAGGDEEVLDVDILVEDNLTKTEKKVTAVPSVKFESVGLISLGFSSSWSNYIASATYTKYFNNFAYRLTYQQSDSLMVEEESGSIYQGAHLNSSLRVGIGIKKLILGTGFLLGNTFKETIDGDDSEPKVSNKDTFLLPFFSLGGAMNIGSNFTIDYILGLYSSSFLRFSTTYNF